MEILWRSDKLTDEAPCRRYASASQGEATKTVPRWLRAVGWRNTAGTPNANLMSDSAQAA